MSIKPLNLHYSFETPASVYDEEAMTALELAGRQGAKINEVINDQNALRESTEKHLEDQDKEMAGQFASIPGQIDTMVKSYMNKGMFDEAINAYAGDLEARLDELIKLEPGSTTGDAELIDARTDFDGVTSETAGTAIRKQGKMLASLIEGNLDIIHQANRFVTKTLTQSHAGIASKTAGHFLFYLVESTYVIDFTPSFGGVSGTITYSIVRMPEGVGVGQPVEILSTGSISAGSAIPVNRVLSKHVGVLVHYNAECPPYSTSNDMYAELPLAIVYQEDLTIHSYLATSGSPFSFAGSYRVRQPDQDTLATWIKNELGVRTILNTQANVSVATKGELWGFAPNNPVFLKSYTPGFNDGQGVGQFTWYVVKSQHGFMKGYPVQVVETGVATIGDAIELNRMFDQSTGLFLHCADYTYYYKGVAETNAMSSRLLRIDSDVVNINSELANRILTGTFEMYTINMESNKLTGHSWSIIGDSNSARSTYTWDINMYYDIINNRSGMTLYEYGVSGDTVVDILARYESVHYSDIITVFAGVNDWGKSVYTPLGKMGDTGSTTFYGALDTLCAGLLKKFPRSLVIFMTPLGDNGFFEVTDANAGGHTIQDYAQAIRDVCEKYMIPVCDLCKCSMLNPQIEELNELYFVDGLHLSDKGHEVIGHLLQSEMERHYIDTI